MEQDTNQKDNLVDTPIKDNKEVSPPSKATTPKPRSSGKGLYITAIVMGIIIVILLALYIYLTITHMK